MIGNLPVKRISLPTPFPVGNINSYLITEDPVTIIDPGLYYQPSEELLTRALEQIGMKFSDIKRVVVTHGHPDHYGMAGKIQHDTGAEVMVREEDRKKIAPDPDYIDKMIRSFRTTGLTEDILSFNYNVVFGADVPFTHPIVKISPYSGETDLAFEGFKIRLLHLPGHSGGHTCLYWKEEGVLFSGDVLLPEITAIPSVEYDPGMKNLRRRSLTEILESLKRISGLNPRLCLPGHGDPVTDPGNLAKSRIDFHMNRLDEIYNLVPLGEENGMTPYSLSGVYYPHVQGFDRLLAVIEVVAHLDRLADEGRIAERIDEEGVSHFYRPA